MTDGQEWGKKVPALLGGVLCLHGYFCWKPENPGWNWHQVAAACVTSGLGRARRQRRGRGCAANRNPWTCLGRAAFQRTGTTTGSLWKTKLSKGEKSEQEKERQRRQSHPSLSRHDFPWSHCGLRMKEGRGSFSHSMIQPVASEKDKGEGDKRNESREETKLQKQKD